MEDLLVYKIRDKKTGLFSRGGCFIRWSKVGKTWRNIGHLKNHLHHWDKLPKEYLDCEIVVLEYKPAQQGTIDLYNLHKEVALSAKIRDLFLKKKSLQRAIDYMPVGYNKELAASKLKLKDVESQLARLSEDDE